jgi:hypothetical protein
MSQKSIYVPRCFVAWQPFDGGATAVNTVVSRNTALVLDKKGLSRI